MRFACRTKADLRMDVVAHGLWGGALFCPRGRKMFLIAVLLGMAPDLLSFGPFFLTRLGTIAERWGTRQRMEPRRAWKSLQTR